MPAPRFPLYIPSKSRAETALTPTFLDSIGVPYRIVVEEHQLEMYAARYPREKLLVLDPAYQRDYDTCDDLGDSKGKGPGPARNFIWDHAVAEGATWHWVMDDNIALFARYHRNRRIPVGDGTIFHAMEEFSLRYENVSMAGPHYWMFVDSRSPRPPFFLACRIYSCNLIRNDVPFRWRGRYNEDTDLSLRMLKAGWMTVEFNAFLQYKVPTQTISGGNTEEFYDVEGTLPKSRMLADLHPDVAEVVWRYGRWHHQVDYSPFKPAKLRRRADLEPIRQDAYRFRLEPRKTKRGG